MRQNKAMKASRNRPAGSFRSAMFTPGRAIAVEIDRTLLRENLKLAVAERFKKFADFARLPEELKARECLRPNRRQEEAFRADELCGIAAGSGKEQCPIHLEWRRGFKTSPLGLSKWPAA